MTAAHLLRTSALTLVVAVLAGCGQDAASATATRGGSTATLAAGALQAGQQAVAPASLDPRAQAAGYLELVPHIVRDDGGRGMEAFRLLVPAGWRVGSAVVWFTPGQACGTGFNQAVVTVVSPDGLSAIEMALAMKFEDTQVSQDLSNIDPEFRRFFDGSDLRATLQQYEAQYRQMGDTCHIGTVNSAQDVYQRYVGPYRRPNARVLAVRPEPRLARQLSSLLAPTAQSVPGSQTYVDAAEFDIQHPAVGGRRVVERVTFGVMGTRHTLPSLSGAGGSTIDSIMTTPIYGVRAPIEQFDATERLARIMISSMRSSPQWDAAIARMYAQQAAHQRQMAQQNMDAQNARHAANMANIQIIADRGQAAAAARAEVADSSMRAWRAGQDAGDRRQQQFIDFIYDGTTVSGPGGAQTRVPYGQTAYSNGSGGLVLGPEGGSAPPGWTAMTPVNP